MKLLLTSSGLTNKSLVAALSDVLTTSFSDTTVTFIPTAANIEPGGKEWLLHDLHNFEKLGLKALDIVDISALPRTRWYPRMEKADVLVFGGGNAYYLMYWLIKSGAKQQLSALLKDKVYVGISAGSMVTTTNFYPSFIHDTEIYGEEIISEEKITQGLGFIDFHVIPHLNSSTFPKARLENIATYVNKTPEPIYVIDDSTAIKVVDSDINVITEGSWKKFN